MSDNTLLPLTAYEGEFVRLALATFELCLNEILSQPDLERRIAKATTPAERLYAVMDLARIATLERLGVESLETAKTMGGQH